jgi:ubiquinone/menaquinone biosynthesis C-methylase UbiE
LERPNPKELELTSENIVGNVYDKYGTKNPIAKALMRGFLDAVTGFCLPQRPINVLEVGCGEGKLADELLAHGLSPRRFVACDLALDRLGTGLNPLIEFKEASIYELPFEDNSFDLVICCEVLEHLEQPERGLQELSRVASNKVVLSTPREPLWRGLNMLRGKYLGDLGNTPGHIQHFSSRGLQRLVGSQLRILDVKKPIPWTVILAEPKRLPSS